MRYAIYTRSKPADTDNTADKKQYDRCQAFARHFKLGTELPHYSDSIKLTEDGAVNGLMNLFDDIRLKRISGVIVVDATFLNERSSALVKIIDFFAAHKTHFLVVKETISCSIK